MSETPIYVTQPALPPLEEYIPYLEKIWENKILTNGGPFHQDLEKTLSEYFGVNQVALFNNGTIALITALQAMNLSGEVITTPYSFLATTHALLWNNLTPVFVDVEPTTLNIDPAKIEAAITPNTTAILAVHCYGNPCDVESIRAIADQYNLKVIYDAAHAFGVKDGGGSILRHGDMSVLSFHATKVFNTFEGGAIICADEETKRRIVQLKNFGLVDEESVFEPGINGKMSELNASFGLLQLEYIDQAITLRKDVDGYYRRCLENIKGVRCVKNSGDGYSNYSYFPILIEDEFPLTRDELYKKLMDNNVYARRYFYPLISEFHLYKNLPSSDCNKLPVAYDASHRVLCLPLYPSLEIAQLEEICNLISSQ